MATVCPYTLEDEPTEDWKVEHVLQWWLLRANAESEAEYNVMVEGLQKQLEEGKKELWEAHEQVSEIVKQSENIENDSSQINVKNNVMEPIQEHPAKASKPRHVQKSKPVVPVPASTRPTRTKKPTEKAAAAFVGAPAPPAAAAPEKPDTIHIDIEGGPYHGKFFDLQPRTRSHAWIGRSKGAKFKDRGISLPEDLEVSTSHGRFEFKQGKFYYTDVASTNGTYIDGKECEPNHPYELKTKGTKILAGQTMMKVTLLKLA